MKRFALFYNMIPEERMKKIPWLIDNFDWIPFRRDVADLNEYELIYVYSVSGGGIVSDWKPVTESNEFPKYLRDNGVTKPKIIYQRDYWHSSIDEFPNPDILSYVDGVIHAGARQWDDLPVPVFYSQLPLGTEMDKRWTDFDDKLNEAVMVRRHNCLPTESRRLAEESQIPIQGLGGNVDKIHDYIEYIDFLSKFKVGLDYHDNYCGWSRFVAECARAGIPVLGPEIRKGVQVANPELCGEPNVDLVNRLLEDKEYYEQSRELAYNNVIEHLSPKACGERIKGIVSSLAL